MPGQKTQMCWAWSRDRWAEIRQGLIKGFFTSNNSPVLCEHQLGVPQFNSFWHYLRLVQMPHIKGLMSTRIPHFRPLQVVDPQITHTLLNLASTRCSQDPLLWFDNLLPKWLIKLRDTFYLYLLVCCKGYYKECRWIARWRGTQGKVQSGAECGSFCPHRVGMWILLAHGCALQPVSSPNLVL